MTNVLVLLLFFVHDGIPFSKNTTQLTLHSDGASPRYTPVKDSNRMNILVAKTSDRVKALSALSTVAKGYSQIKATATTFVNNKSVACCKS